MTKKTDQDVPKKKANYVTSREFYHAVVEARIKGYITPKLEQIFMLLCERNANNRHFVRYHHIRADIISVSLLACVKGFPKWRPFKDKHRYWDEATPIEYDYEVCSNTFAFFTTCIHNALKQFLKDEYTQININNKMRLTLGLPASDGYCDMIKEKEEKSKHEAEEGEVDGVEDEEVPFVAGEDDEILDMSVWDDYESTDDSIVEHYTETEESH